MLKKLLIGIFTGVPTVFLVMLFAWERRINWWLFAVWVVIVILGMAFSAGGGPDA